MNSTRGNYPEWEGSDAQKLLKKDMEDGRHETMQPMELWETRDTYLLFPLDVFRDHIYQEIRTNKYLKQCKADEKYGDKWKDFQNKEDSD